jgi:tripartite-type tricarboxylate transporter receptor subunit TctC
MRSTGASAAILAFGIVATGAMPQGPARADSVRNSAVADFYSGKSVTLTVSASAGGGYDTLARTAARFLGRHLPGHPIVIVKNRAGAGGITATNFLYNDAERDGTQIGLVQNDIPFEPLFGTRSTRYQPTAFNWLGSPSVETGLLAVWHASPVNTLDDARQREITVGTAGPASTAAFHARLLNALFGLRLKTVGNYPGQTEAFFAMERGEIDGYPSIFYSNLQVTRPDWLPQNKIKVLVAYGPEKRAELANTPYAPEIVGTPEDRLLLDAAFAPLALGRPFVMPPGVPPDRLAAMRAALSDTFADPAFRAESVRLGLDAGASRDGEQIRRVIDNVYATPAPVLDRLRHLNTVSR